MRTFSYIRSALPIFFVATLVVGCKNKEPSPEDVQEYVAERSIDIEVVAPTPNSIPDEPLDGVVNGVAPAPIAPPFLGPKVVMGSQGALKKASTGNGDSEEHEPLCGNGILDAGEQCDDGNKNIADYCKYCRIYNINCTAHSSDDSQYIFCLDTVNWDEARAICQKFGPFDLTSINDSTENTFIDGFQTADSAWIGANDIDNEGTFVWVNGEPFSYTNWRAGEPNDQGGEDCTEIYADADWNDLPCSEPNEFICEVLHEQP